MKGFVGHRHVAGPLLFTDLPDTTASPNWKQWVVQKLECCEAWETPKINQFCEEIRSSPQQWHPWKWLHAAFFTRQKFLENQFTKNTRRELQLFTPRICFRISHVIFSARLLFFASKLAIFPLKRSVLGVRKGHSRVWKGHMVNSGFEDPNAGWNALKTRENATRPQLASSQRSAPNWANNCCTILFDGSGLPQGPFLENNSFPLKVGPRWVLSICSNGSKSGFLGPKVGQNASKPTSYPL